MMVGFNWPLVPVSKPGRLAKPVHPFLEHTVASTNLLSHRLASRSLLLHALVPHLEVQSASKRKAEGSLNSAAKRRKLEQIVSLVAHSTTTTTILGAMVSSMVSHKTSTTNLPIANLPVIAPSHPSGGSSLAHKVASLQVVANISSVSHSFPPNNASGQLSSLVSHQVQESTSEMLPSMVAHMIPLYTKPDMDTSLLAHRATSSFKVSLSEVILSSRIATTALVASMLALSTLHNLLESLPGSRKKRKIASQTNDCAKRQRVTSPIVAQKAQGQAPLLMLPYCWPILPYSPPTNNILPANKVEQTKASLKRKSNEATNVKESKRCRFEEFNCSLTIESTKHNLVDEEQVPPFSSMVSHQIATNTTSLEKSSMLSHQTQSSQNSEDIFTLTSHQTNNNSPSEKTSMLVHQAGATRSKEDFVTMSSHQTSTNSPHMSTTSLSHQAKMAKEESSTIVAHRAQPTRGVNISLISQISLAPSALAGLSTSLASHMAPMPSSSSSRYEITISCKRKELWTENKECKRRRISRPALLMITYCWPMAIYQSRRPSQASLSLTSLGRQLSIIATLATTLPITSITSLGSEMLTMSLSASKKRKLEEIEYFPQMKRLQLDESSSKKRRRSAEETSFTETKMLKKDFFETKMVETSLTSSPPLCLAIPGLCDKPNLNLRTFPTNILHLLAEEEVGEEYDELEDDEKLEGAELIEAEFDEEETGSFKAGSLWDRTLCLSSPGLCHSSTAVTPRSLPPNIAHLLQEEGGGVENVNEEKVEEEEEKEHEDETDERTLVDILGEETVEFEVGELSAAPSLCLSPTLCPCNQVFSSR